MKDEIINDGFLAPDIKEVRKSKRAGFYLGAKGGVTGAVINPSGDWTKYWPPFEQQASSEPGVFLDTNGCATFNTIAPIRALLRFKGYKDEDYSERFTAIVSGTDPRRGNDPHKVAESIRKHGLLPAHELPFLKTFRDVMEFYSPIPMLRKYFDIAARWLLDKAFAHEWVFTPDDKFTPAEKRARLKEALTKGTVAVSVKAWRTNSEGLYTKQISGEADTHWTGLMRYDDDNGICGDSYPPFEKKLIENYAFEWAKVYYINPLAIHSLNILEQILASIAKIIPILAVLVQRKVAEREIPIVQIDATEPPKAEMPEQKSKIEIWASAIEKEEGFAPKTRSWRNNNPGNIKFSPLIQKLGATHQDPDGFAVFPSYAAGREALCDFLTLACENMLVPYKNARTLKQFTQVYAHPPANHPYAENVAKKLKVDVEIDISKLL